MNINLLNGGWLIIVTLIVNNAFGQISVNPNNNAEIRINCDQFSEINPPMASSTCGGELAFSFEDKLYSGGCMGTIERIWTIRDQCDNVSNYQQFIRLDDKTAPELSEYPSDVSVSINEIPEIPQISANDNCEQNLNVKFSEEIFKDENENTKSIIRTWSVKDKCGNVKTHKQIISITSGNS